MEAVLIVLRRLAGATDASFDAGVDAVVANDAVTVAFCATSNKTQHAPPPPQ